MTHVERILCRNMTKDDIIRLMPDALGRKINTSKKKLDLVQEWIRDGDPIAHPFVIASRSKVLIKLIEAGKRFSTRIKKKRAAKAKKLLNKKLDLKNH